MTNTQSLVITQTVKQHILVKCMLTRHLPQSSRQENNQSSNKSLKSNHKVTISFKLLRLQQVKFHIEIYEVSKLPQQSRKSIII